MSSWRSDSWIVLRPLPSQRVSDWPVRSSTRDDAWYASSKPPIAFAAPGPVLTSATPSPPVARA